MSTKNLNFSITGDYITDHVRNAVLSEKIYNAIEILDSMGIPGIMQEDILFGNAKLVGVNELTLEEDNDEKYKKSLKEIYRNVIFYKGSFYKVKGIIVSFNKNHEFLDFRFKHIYKENNNDIFLFNKNGEAIYLEAYSNYMNDFFKEYITLNTIDSIDLRYLVKFGETLIEEKDFIEHEVRKIVRNIFDLKDIPYLEDEERDIFEEEVSGRFSYLKKLNEIEFDNKVANLRKKILEKSSSFIKIGNYNIPREPFVKWCKGLEPYVSDRFEEEVAWEVISHSGLKMHGDNPYHTDWIIGAGIDPQEFYRSDLEKAVTEFLTKRSTDIIVLSGSGEVTEILTDNLENCKDKILIIPHAGVEYFEAAKQAKAVICKIGGEGAHLVVNAKEYGLNICIAFHLYERLKEEYIGETICTDFDKNKIYY